MIGIICAMVQETEAILALCSNISEKTIANRQFYEAELAEKKVVICRSGVAKGNAVLTTTLLLEHFPIEKVLNIGVAGGLKADQNISDLVISSAVVQHDYDTSPLDGEEGIGLKFESDPHLISIAQDVANSMEWVSHTGVVASGDQFIATHAQIDRILKYFPDANCAEMEAGGIAQVASNYGVPFVVIRALSDVAVVEGNEVDFMDFVVKASQASAKFCEKCVRKY